MKRARIMIELLKSNEKLWNLFTKKEEYNPSMLDKHQRFSYHFSEHKNVLDPEVSKFLVENGFEFFWPDDKKFAVCLTHDIDNIYPSWKYRYFTSLKLGLKFRFKEALNRFLKEENPYWNFRETVDLERKYDARSSFYIITANKDIRGYPYDAIDLKDELRYLVDNGCEVGLHGGYYSYANVKAMKKEKRELERILGKEVIGYRNHYLRFKVPDTWELLGKAGFKYDTTFTYADMVGFRNGMCHPFKPFNLNVNKEIDILEIPLTIMDGTLFSYMKLSFNEAWEICKKLIDTIEKYNGVLTVLWHNTSFDDIFYKDWGKLYEKILRYCYEKNAWMTSSEEIYNWWSKPIKFHN